MTSPPRCVNMSRPPRWAAMTLPVGDPGGMARRSRRCSFVRRRLQSTGDAAGRRPFASSANCTAAFGRRWRQIHRGAGHAAEARPSGTSAKPRTTPSGGTTTSRSTGSGSCAGSLCSTSSSAAMSGAGLPEVGCPDRGCLEMRTRLTGAVLQSFLGRLTSFAALVDGQRGIVAGWPVRRPMETA
jgi:hypothetical protein